MMQVVYASSVCSRRRFSEIFPTSGTIPGQQVQKYHRLMLEGLARNEVPVTAVTGVPIVRANSHRYFVNIHSDIERGVRYEYLPTVNIPILRNIVVVLASFVKTLRLLRNDREAVLVCDVLNFSVASGALLAAKILARGNAGIVTDIPALLSENPRRVVTWFTTFAMLRYDSYIFLTQQMSDLVNRRGVPEVVIEGLVDIEMKDRENKILDKHPQIVCLYAGAIDRRYGLEMLVQGFLRTRTVGAELRIYGGGDYENALKIIARENPRVKYFGVVPNEEVVQEQLRATLLVNPRPSTLEFTRYSFPSKNTEYMVSGTPLLTTALPGMPEEYLPFVFLLQDETAAGVTAALDALFALDPNELHIKGREAKAFALLHKNNVIQAARVLRLLESPGGAASNRCSISGTRGLTRATRAPTRKN